MKRRDDGGALQGSTALCNRQGGNNEGSQAEGSTPPLRRQPPIPPTCGATQPAQHAHQPPLRVFIALLGPSGGGSSAE